MEQKNLLDKDYKELFISELLVILPREDNSSVQKLAASAAISKTIIQGLRKGK